MSGGVDSSVAAMLLQQQGYRVTGVFMRNWDGQDETGSDVCTADADLEDAQMVGACLGIPIETVNFSREYWHEVFAPSVEEFERCRTPNMDVACNRFIKFDAFRDHALDSMGADFVATGHYARTRPGPGGDWDSPLLVQAVDANKDQTYFLCAVPSSCLAKVLFPLGGLTKPEVRELAAKAGLPVAKKRESMGVCFVGKRRSWAEFISQYLRPKPGNFVCVDSGDVVGKHDGVQLYTVGQKSHLSGMSEKHFVAALDAETNSVIVAKGASHPSLFSWGLSSRASEFHWVAGVPPRELLVLRSPSTLSLSSAVCSGVDGGVGDARLPAVDSVEGLRDTQGGASTAGAAADAGGASRGDDDDADNDDDSGSEARRGLLRCTYRCRHRQELLPCTVELRDGHTNSRRRRIDDSAVNTEKEEAEERGEEEEEGGKRKTQALVTLRFDEPAKAIAPGQVVALYRDGVCLGGGSILRAEGALLSGKKTPLSGFVGDNSSVFPFTGRRQTAS